MELIDYILKNMFTRLILRMDLMRSSGGGVGLESVRTGLICYYGDDDGPEVVYLSFEQPGLHTGHHRLKMTPLTSRFFREDVERDVAFALNNFVLHEWRRNGWGVRTDNQMRLCTDALKGEPLPAAGERWKPLSTANVLVLQHVARLQGAILQLAATPGQDMTFVLHDTVRRLSGMLKEGNEQLARLTTVS